MTATYEELILELRQIVSAIEEGDIGLDESIRLYERGSELVKRCEQLLEDAELKITELGCE
ncbi:MAG: exodeoxyribonuclease VII small subunit [Methanomicrobiaceae archaeon]|nr:exodeoxyribonuclease VII small subunit [Methanomicrobiaceae archaeon]